MVDSEQRTDSKGVFSDEGKRLALVVGVNKSTESKYLAALKYAEDDAREMAKALASSACNFALFGSAPLLGKEATTRSVQEAIVKLIQQSTPQDFLCFYFSGHAKPINVRGKRKEIYLVTHDFNESQVKRVDRTHHLSLRWLWEVLYENPEVGRILIVLDCCFAGGMPTGPDPYLLDFRQLFAEYLEGNDAQGQTDRSRYILAASGHDAMAHEQNGHGVMTGLLLRALRGEVRTYDEEGYIEISSVYTYLHKEMPDRQKPTRSDKGSKRFVIAWHRPETQNDAVATMVLALGDFLKRFEVANRSKSHHALPFDHTLCRDASLSDIDMKAVARLLEKERVQKQPWFHPNMTNEELLENLNLLQEGVLTYGAILCFGINPSKEVTEAFTRCISYKGNERREGWEEDQEFRGSLLEQYESSLAFLQKSLHLSRVISAEGSIEQWEIPPEVLREALANALIHREYADQRSSVRVEIFDNRIEISNPGGLFGSLTIEQLGSEGIYPLRNPYIAHVFYLCNYVEKLGTGIARIQQTIREVGLPEPLQFDTDDGRTFFKVILHRPQRMGRA